MLLSHYPNDAFCKRYIIMQIIHHTKTLLYKWLNTIESIRDGSLVACVEEIDDIILYFMDFLFPSQIYVKIFIPL